MKIRLRNNQEVRDVSPDVSDMMVAAGLADPLTEKEINNATIGAVPPHFLNWHATPGDLVDDFEFPPHLIWRCQECAQVTVCRPNEKPADLKIFHWGKQHCPDEVAARYLSLFHDWAKRNRNIDTREKLQKAIDAVLAKDNRFKQLKSGAVVTL